jgi:hypothetical protein
MSVETDDEEHIGTPPFQGGFRRLDGLRQNRLEEFEFSSVLVPRTGFARIEDKGSRIEVFLCTSVLVPRTSNLL